MAENTMDCPRCGRPIEDHQHLTDDEFKAVTKAWIARLRDEMGRAGCNDVFAGEFPESVAKKFHFDLEVLEAWEERLDLLE